MKKSRTVQRMVNTYPEWSRIRTDEQSLGYQLFNVIGNRTDILDQQLTAIGKNYSLPTVNLDEIDLVYVVDLDNDFEFEVDSSDITHTVPTVPTVIANTQGPWYNSIGLINPSGLSIQIAAENDIQTFWYESIPTRLAINTTSSGTYVVLPETSIAGSPISTGFAEPHTPGNLHITINDGDTFIRTTNNEIVRGLVTIEGTTRRNTEKDEETLVFLANDTKTTSKEWREITKVRAFGIEPNTATIKIISASFNNGPYLEFYNLDHGLSGNKVDTFWDIGVTASGTRTLDQIRFNTEDPRTLLLGFTAKQAIRQFELLSTSGSAIVPLDVALQPFSTRAWVCSATKLYLYSLDLSYPDMSLLTKKEYDSSCAIEVDNYWKVRNNSVDISYRIVRPLKDIDQHRVTVKKPDGTTWGILNGILVPSSSNLWVEGTISARELRAPDVLVLDQRGAYVFTLEVQYTDNTKNFDQRVVTVDSQNALAEFSLSGFATGGVTAVGISFDSDQKLWILDSTGKMHQLAFATDIMLVDYDQKRIFFKEDYDTVVVDS